MTDVIQHDPYAALPEDTTDCFFSTPDADIRPIVRRSSLKLQSLSFPLGCALDGSPANDEEWLCNLIVGMFGAFRGSVAVETIQNWVRTEHPVLFESVLERHYRRRMLRFLQDRYCSKVIALDRCASPWSGVDHWRAHLIRDAEVWRAVDKERHEYNRRRCLQQLQQFLPCANTMLHRTDFLRIGGGRNRRRLWKEMVYALTSDGEQVPLERQMFYVNPKRDCIHRLF